MSSFLSMFKPTPTAKKHCALETQKREFCYKQSLHDKGGEDCLVEELQEKRCFSSKLCPKESRAFYGRDDNSKAVCSLWAEAFAYTRDDHPVDFETRQLHEQGKSFIDADRSKQSKCRAVLHDLAKCMHSFKWAFLEPSFIWQAVEITARERST